MKKRNRKLLTAALTFLGSALIILALLTLLISTYKAKSAAENAEELVCKLKELMPEATAGIIEDRGSLGMAAAEVDGQNFVGILEVPLYESELPLYYEWDKTKVHDYPCCFTGSIYDSSLVIGGCDNEGQLDFLDDITITDKVCVTDMTGAVYTYSVTFAEKAKEIKTEELTNKDADLIIFAKNSFSFDYTVVLCELDTGK